MFAAFSTEKSTMGKGFGVRSAPAVFASADPQIHTILKNVVNSFFQQHQHTHHPKHNKLRTPPEALDCFKRFLTVELSKEKHKLSKSDGELLAHHQQVVSLLQLEPTILEAKEIDPQLKLEMENFKKSIAVYSANKNRSFKEWIGKNWNKATYGMWKRIKGGKSTSLLKKMSYSHPDTKKTFSTSKPEEVANVLATRLTHTFRKVPVHRQNWLKHIHLLPTATDLHQQKEFTFTIDDVLYGFSRNGSHRAPG